MKTYILKFICVFLISTLAFLLSACNVSNGYKPTADATWATSVISSNPNGTLLFQMKFVLN